MRNMMRTNLFRHSGNVGRRAVTALFKDSKLNEKFGNLSQHPPIELIERSFTNDNAGYEAFLKVNQGFIQLET